MKGKKLPVLGAGLWILGLVLFLVGLNIHTDTGRWMAVLGNIAVLAGLALEGVVWMKKHRDQEPEKEENSTST